MHTNKSRISVIKFKGLCTKHADMYDCMKISSYIYFFTIFYWNRNSVNSFLCKYNFLNRKAENPSSMFGQMLFFS